LCGGKGEAEKCYSRLEGMESSTWQKNVLDISSIRGKSYGGSCFWVLIVDDYTDYCWSIVLKTKGILKVKVMTLLTDLKIAGIEVKIIRCDDSG
jgi:hypothetical protein